jgi:acyl-CoA thioester hydrolase
VRSSVIGATDRLLWIWHELWVAARRRATEDLVDTRSGRSAPFPADVATRIDAVREPPGDRGGGRIRLADRA